MKFLCLSIVIVSFFYANTQENELKFPESYFGSYKGDLIIENAKGQQIIGMEFHINATETANKYQYQLVYISNGNRQERNYNLIAKDASKGEYLVDENNGILLSAKQFENRLYSVFQVQENLLFTIEEFYEDYMIFEIVFSNKKETVKSGNIDEETPEVFSYPVTVSQRAKLLKQ